MILIILGMVVICWVIVKLWPYQKLKTWDEIECTINQAETSSFEESQVYVAVTLLRPIVKYSYRYNGLDYSCDTISLEEKINERKSRIRQFILV